MSNGWKVNCQSTSISYLCGSPKNRYENISLQEREQVPTHLDKLSISLITESIMLDFSLNFDRLCQSKSSANALQKVILPNSIVEISKDITTCAMYYHHECAKRFKRTTAMVVWATKKLITDAYRVIFIMCSIGIFCRKCNGLNIVIQRRPIEILKIMAWYISLLAWISRWFFTSWLIHLIYKDRWCLSRRNKTQDGQEWYRKGHPRLNPWGCNDLRFWFSGINKNNPSFSQ